MADAKQGHKTVHPWQWLLLILAALSLLFAESSYWLRHTIFDIGTFSSITSTTLKTEANRTAVASVITQSVLRDWPTLNYLIGSRMTSLTSGILGSDFGQRVLSEVVDQTHAYLIKSDRQDIVIHTSSVKQVVSQLVTVANTAGRDVDFSADTIPDTIVLLEKDALPDLNGTYKTLLVVAPLLWVAAIGFAVWFVALGKSAYAKRLYAVLVAALVVAVVGLLTGPFVPPALAAFVANITIQPLAESLTAAFLAPFIVQMWWLVGITVMVGVLVSQRRRIANGTQRVVTKVKG